MSARLAIVEEIAHQAGEILLHFYHMDELASHLKEDRSLVTQADIEADGWISKALRSHFPDDEFLSEELAPEYMLPRSGDPPALWVIDPLDGTTNFSLKMHHWGISLARLEQGMPVMGVLYFPLTGELFTAERGKGAELNHVPLKIKPDPNQKLSFFSCCSRTFRIYDVEIPYKARILGCASYSFCTVARGSASIAMEATPKVWDIAAAWLIIKEAGGAVTSLDGKEPFPLQYGIEYSHCNFPSMAAESAEKLQWGLSRVRLKQPRSQGRQA